ncbi:winged helix-turn-helix domain-containing protein [Castellaniella hirudinis]|uniref:winged helix-turn-helix domain-containing protein n=1 Tax=Castellaniella hirudinis TaxID=1144617 RepID=UPI0039C0C356
MKKNQNPKDKSQQSRLVWVLAPDDQGWGNRLSTEGYQVRCFEEEAELRRRHRGLAGQPLHAVVLMGEVAANCKVAQQVRSRGGQTLMVARTRLLSRAEIAALLSQGVDSVLRPKDNAHTLMAVLRALEYRQAQQAATVEAPWRLSDGVLGSQYRIGPWRLDEKGWLLVHEDTGSLRLTPAERALLLGFFEAPGHVVAHRELLDAVLQIWPEDRHQALLDQGCRDLFSRLRRRAESAGMPRPPIENLLDYGYVWTL